VVSDTVQEKGGLGLVDKDNNSKNNNAIVTKLSDN